MDSRKLAYFVEAVEQGSLNKAASELHVSQPALSKAIRLLESPSCVLRRSYHQKCAWLLACCTVLVELGFDADAVAFLFRATEISF